MKLIIFFFAVTLASRVLAAPAEPSGSDGPDEKREPKPSSTDNDNKSEQTSENTSETPETSSQKPETTSSNSYIDYFNMIEPAKPVVYSSTQSTTEPVLQDVKEKAADYSIPINKISETIAKNEKETSSGNSEGQVTQVHREIVSHDPKEIILLSPIESVQQKISSQTITKKDLQEKHPQVDSLLNRINVEVTPNLSILTVPHGDISTITNNSTISNNWQTNTDTKKINPPITPKEFTWSYKTSFGQHSPADGEQQIMKERPFPSGNQPGDLARPGEAVSDADVLRNNYPTNQQQIPPTNFDLPDHNFPGKTFTWPQQQNPSFNFASTKPEHPNNGDISFATIAFKHETPGNIFPMIHSVQQSGINNGPNIFGNYNPGSQYPNRNYDHNQPQLPPSALNPLGFMLVSHFNTPGPIRNSEVPPITNPFDLLPFNPFKSIAQGSQQPRNYNYRFSTSDRMDPLRPPYLMPSPPFSPFSANNPFLPQFSQPSGFPFGVIPPVPHPGLNIPTWPFMF